MQQDDIQIKMRQLKTVVVVAIIIIVVLALVNGLTKLGKTKLSITVAPEGSKISINGKKSSDGTHYLKPGQYTITASKEGYKNDEVSVTLENKVQEVTLLPSPETTEAKQELLDNPEVQHEREALGAKKADSKGQSLEEMYPFVKLLPFSNLSEGQFKIDYGLSKDRENDIFLDINDSTPEGRKAALNWIQKHNQDPTDIEIHFTDFINPFVYGKGETGE